MTVNRERMELWAQALESEKYIQCKGALRWRPGAMSNDPYAPQMHCALGVGMAVAEAHGVKIEDWEWSESSNLPGRVLDWYGLKGIALTAGILGLIAVNDRLELPFWDIAQLLRAKYVKEEQS